MLVQDWTVEYFLSNNAQCIKALDDLKVLKQIPCLNNASLDYFKNGQLVCFRGMLQDTHNPEFFFKNFQVLNKITGETSIRSGMFSDGAQCQPNEKIMVDADTNESAQRQTWVVISTPGLNDWAKDSSTNSINSKLESSSQSITNKRPLDETDEPMDLEPIKKKDKASNDASSSSEMQDSKISQVVSRDHILNFPIPNEEGKACIVKLYEEHPYKLNQIFDIYGFLSLDPNLSTDMGMMGNELEMQVHYPPTSIVPRLHAIKVIEVSNDYPESREIISKAESIRGDLKTVLSQLLFGDELAAEYLICHLISSVYMRQESLCLGAYSINLSNFPKEHANFVKNLYHILKQIIFKSHIIELTLENLNEMSLVPKKDYDCDRLTSGILQLSKNTHLIIDETSLTTGRVTEFGRQNYQILKDLIEFQKLSYDFKYFSTGFETDIPVLIFSEVKSFIPCQTRIIIYPEPDVIKIYPQVIEAATQFLTIDENRLNNIRQYINALKNTKFTFSEEVSETIENDFVKLRQADSKFSADSLHALLVFSRLMCLSHGITTLNVEMWKKSLKLEEERLRRLSNMSK